MEMTHAVGALSALSQEHRLRIFRLLVRVGHDGLPAGTIAEELGIPPATLSFHLKELSRAGLVISQRHGRFVIYAPNIEGIRGLMSFLLEDCCQGRPELCLPTVCTPAVESCCDATDATESGKRKETPA